jgi:hypothetical protein
MEAPWRKNITYDVSNLQFAVPFLKKTGRWMLSARTRLLSFEIKNVLTIFRKNTIC